MMSYTHSGRWIRKKPNRFREPVGRCFTGHGLDHNSASLSSWRRKIKHVKLG